MAASGSPEITKSGEYDHLLSDSLISSSPSSPSSGALPSIPIEDWQKLTNVVKTYLSAVCQIITKEGKIWKRNGTGFLVGPRLILTNQHVIHASNVKDSFAIFNTFSIDGRITGDISAVEFNTAEEQGGCFINGLKGDYTFVGIEQTIATQRFAREIFSMKTCAKPDYNDQVFILHHPKVTGEDKLTCSLNGSLRISLGNMQGRSTEQQVNYLLDTKSGSSGGPIVNGAGELVALHRQGTDGTCDAAGIPIKWIQQQLRQRDEEKKISQLIETERLFHSEPQSARWPEMQKKDEEIRKLQHRLVITEKINTFKNDSRELDYKIQKLKKKSTNAKKEINLLVVNIESEEKSIKDKEELIKNMEEEKIKLKKNRKQLKLNIEKNEKEQEQLESYIRKLNNDLMRVLVQEN